MPAPVFVSALTSQDGLTVEVLLGGGGVTSILPSSGGITGWTLVQDPAGVSTTIPIASATRKGSSGADVLTVVITLQTRITALATLKISYSSGTGNVTAQDATVMATYAGSNGNVTNYTGRPMFLSAATTLDGRYVDVRFTDYDNTAILPSVANIPGFTVKKGGSGGTTLPYSNVKRKGSTGDDAKTVRITLSSLLDYTDTNLVVKYIPDVTTYITDNSTPPVPALTFDWSSVTQNTIERLPPTYASATTSTDGLKVYVLFNEPPSSGKILPESTNISGFTIQEDPGGGYVSRTIVSALRSTDTLAANYQRTIIITLAEALTKGNNYKVIYAHVAGKPKVTDAVAIPNELQPFTSSAISNTSTTERLVPTFSSASVATTSTVTMTFTEPGGGDPLLPASTPSGFTVRSNGSTLAGTIARTANTVYTFTRSSGTFHPEDYVTVQYIFPTTNFVTDSNNNKLASFGPSAATNSLANDATATPQFNFAETSTDGKKLLVYIRENRSSTPFILPATGITGFYCRVNNVPRDIIKAIRGSSVTTSTDVNRTIELTLAAPVFKGDVIELNYYQPNGNVTDNESKILATFTTNPTNKVLAVAAAVADTNQLFDPLYWSLTGFSDLQRAGYLFERRHGWPLASAILDTTPPVGDVVINENPGSGGIRVHHFAAYGSTQIANTGGATEELDALYEATQFTASGTYDISSIGVFLKKQGTITNQSERLFFSIYSDSNGKPGTRLTTSADNISYGALTNSFVENKFTFSLQLENAKKYWFVINRSAAVVGTADPKLYIETKNPPTGEYATSTDATAWTLFTGKSFAYKIYAQNVDAQPQSGYDEIRDALDIPVKQAEFFGGEDNENEYELIGIGNYRHLVKRLDKVADASDGNALKYPEIRSIELGMTASKPKAYRVEARTSLTGAFSPLFTMIADSTTRDYYRYTFTAPVRLAEIKVSYKGDFYAISNNADITLSATDPLTDVSSVQVSHYTDFHDAEDFPNADSDGWVPFTEGISSYDWELVNEADTYVGQDGIGTTGPLRGALIYGSIIVAHDDTNIYSFISAGTLSLRYTVATLGVTIKSIAIHREVVYVGLSNGKILQSVDAINYTQLNDTTIAASVTALVSYRGKLWIGTARNSNNKSKLYTWDGTTMAFVRSFDQPVIKSMAVGRGYLFLGTATDANLEQGSIYYCDGSSWSLTLDTTANGVDSLMYSTGDTRLWAGLEGGSIYALKFDSVGKPDSWTRVYDGDATHYLHISDDPNGDFVWACSDTGLVLYNIEKKIFSTVPWPAKTSGLMSVWTNSDSTNYQTVGAGTSQIFYGGVRVGGVGPIDWPNLTTGRPTGVNTTYINTSWSGYIVSSTNSSVTFNITLGATDGARVYIDGHLIIDAWTDQVDLTGVYNLIAGKYTAFKMEYYHGSGTGNIDIRWTPGPVVIPTSAFGMPNTVNEVVYIGGTAYAAVSDAKLYQIDASQLSTKKRTVYVRFKDSAGNTTPTPGLSDSILQDAPTRDGVRISEGNIWQVSNTDKTVVATFTSPVASSLKAPVRKIRQDGYYESEPFYSPTLTRWDKISFIAVLPAGTFQGEGLEQGVEVSLEVRTGDTRTGCLDAEWGDAMTYSTITDPGIAGTSVDTALNGDFNISTITKKWLQYRLTLVTASKNITPEVKAVTLSFVEAQASYFFTTMFDTSIEAVSPYPQFRRGLLTANMAPNGGMIKFGYTTETDSVATFNFARYTEITPNTVFELPVPAQQLRFGILFVSVMSDPAPTTLYSVADCKAATTAALPSSAAIVYSNGASGVGATLTRGENGALGTIDGVTVSVSDRILVKNQANPIQNGVYVVSNLGSGGAPYVLTRATDSDSGATEMRYGLFTKVTSGTSNGLKNFFMKTADVITVGTSSLQFVVFEAAIVDDFALQLDAGTADMKFMD